LELSSGQIDALRSILKDAGELAVLVGDDAKPYNVDWMNKYRGQGAVVLRPKTVQQVSEIMKYCNKENIAVVPQGGNTGLVGTQSLLFPNS
jgi:(R)-2-hydroxyglutarate---pyruvate transhydrogenase